MGGSYRTAIEDAMLRPTMGGRRANVGVRGCPTRGGHLRRTAGSLTISATTLLHEAYLDLAGRAAVAFPDRNRFLGYASRAMRGLIIDYVRHRGASKRGGELTFTSLEDHHAPPDGGAVDSERLGGALEELAAIDPQLVAQRWLHLERAVEERTQSQPEGSIQFLHWRASD